MAKREDSVIMRRKINVNETLLSTWRKNYFLEIRNLINSWLLKEEDLDQTFEHQDRTFKIVGSTEGSTIILEEIFENEKIYWECTRFFVQMKLLRFYQEYYKIKGILMTRNIRYSDNKLFLPPIGKGKKSEKEEVEDEEDFQEEILVSDFAFEELDTETSEDDTEIFD